MTPKASGVRYRLLVKDGSSQWEFLIEKRTFTLGRTNKANFVIPLQILSSIHLEFSILEGTGCFVTDKGSTNGTYLKGEKLDPNKPYLLASPFNLRIGLKSDFQFELTDLSIRETEKVPKELSRTRDLPSNSHLSVAHSEIAAQARAQAISEANELDQRLAAQKEIAEANALRAHEKQRESELALLEVEKRIRLAENEILLMEEKSRVVDTALRALSIKQQEAERQHQDAQSAADTKNKEVYALAQQLESLRKEVSGAEKKRDVLESDSETIERAIQEKSSQKKQLDSLASDLERKITQFAEQESDLKKSIESLKIETEAYRNQREESRLLFEEVLQKKERLESDYNDKQRALQELTENYSLQEKKLKDALQKESDAHSELHKSLKLIAEKEEGLATHSEKLERIKKEIQEKHSALDSVSSQLDSIRKSKEIEDKEYQLVLSKHNALKETASLLESQRKTSESAIDSLRAELLTTEAKLKRVNAEFQDVEDKAMRLKSEVSSELQHSQDLKHEIFKLEESRKHLHIEHDEKVHELQEALQILSKEENEKLQAQLKAAKEQHAKWESAERERVSSELKVRKDELLAWENSEKARLQKTFVSQGEKQERDLAERRQKELSSIEEIKVKWNREREAKRPLEIKEIVRSADSLLSAHLTKLNLENEKRETLLNAFKSDLEGAVRSVLLSVKGAQVENHLKAVLVQSPDETLKAQKKRKVWAAQGAVVLFLLIISAVFPEIPLTLWESGTSAFRRDPQSMDAFVKRVQEARANRPKFMPQRDRVFRNTYTDNLIYLQDYSEIKNDELVKNAWTLALNKFFIHELDMDERVIVTFMAIEGPLVTDLTEMAAKIQLSTQESDISRMRAFEDLGTPRLIEVVKGRANYDKLRNFEYKFYDEYSNKLAPSPELRVPAQNSSVDDSIVEESLPSE